MRTNLDFTPLFRSSIGFDRIFDMLENASRVTTIDNWPPYDIAKTGEDEYRITMAVAGFAPEELSLTAQPNLLVVAGRKQGDQDSVGYLHHGLAMRAFERRFDLADYVQVKGASLENGLLSVDLVREVPEALKPRTIQIGTGPKPQVIESKNAA